MKSTVPRGRSRRRRLAGAVPAVRLASAPPRKIKASRRAFFKLYAPRFLVQARSQGFDWRTARPALMAILLSVALIAALYEAFNNSAFYVEGLAVSGNRLVHSDDLNQAGAVRGWNIFFVNPREVEDSLSRLPEVKASRVTLTLPNGVEAEVVERLPRFLWESRGSSFWVDDDGIALRVRANIPGLLHMRDADGTAVKIGERVNADAFNAAVSLRNAWPTGPRSFEWTREHGLGVLDEHGWLVYFGSAKQMVEKMAAMKIVALQVEKDQKNISFIDVGSGLPYYKEATPKK